MNFLIDYNLTGDAVLFWGTLAAEGWVDLLSIRFLTFKQARLPTDSSDRIVWQFVQANQMIREENIATSLPILTIGNPDRFDECSYREKCAARLVDILLDIENYMGAGRIFIP
jgi:hypothetical protein